MIKTNEMSAFRMPFILFRYGSALGSTALSIQDKISSTKPRSITTTKGDGGVDGGNDDDGYDLYKNWIKNDISKWIYCIA